MSRTASYGLAALCLLLTAPAPATAGPRKLRSKVRPNYLLRLQAPMLEDGVDTQHGPPLTSYLRSKLGQSRALDLGADGAARLEKRALRRHLSRNRLAGLSTVPRATCKVSRQTAGKTVVRCRVSLLLMTLRQRSLVSAYSCEAEVSSRRRSTPPEFIERMRKDVLAAAAEGAVDDLVAFLEENKPGTGRLPRRGR